MDRMFKTALVSFALTATGLLTAQQAQAQAPTAPELTWRNTRIHFIEPLKERIIRETGYGLLLEGESADALVKASKGAAK